MKPIRSLKSYSVKIVFFFFRYSLTKTYVFHVVLSSGHLTTALYIFLYRQYVSYMSRDTAVGIATRYALVGPGIEYGW